MRVGDKQRLFAELAGRLVLKAFTSGFQVAIGEVYRPPEMARLYADTCRCKHHRDDHTAATRTGPSVGCTRCRCIEFQAKGIVNSLHCNCLAIDLNLFKQVDRGKWHYCRSSSDHLFLGEWWEHQHELCRWGGRFQHPDGGHYSLSHQGRK